MYIILHLERNVQKVRETILYTFCEQRFTIKDRICAYPNKKSTGVTEGECYTMKNATMDAKRMVNRYGSLRTMLVVEGLLVGVFAGLVTSLYRYLLDRADDIRNAAIGFCSGSPLRMLGWFGALAVMAVVVTLLLKWEPMISGSGIPQVEAELMGYIRPCWWRVVLGKIAAGFVCILGGLSLGREGPSVQLGGMAGKGISRGLKRFRLEEHFLITCGASPVSCSRWRKFIKISPRWCCCRVWQRRLWRITFPAVCLAWSRYSHFSLPV